MSFKKILLAVAIVIVVIPTAYYDQADSSNDEIHLKRDGIEFDPNDNVIVDHNGEKTAYGPEYVIGKDVLSSFSTLSKLEGQVEKPGAGYTSNSARNNNQLELHKKFGIFGSNIGLSGINTRDIDQDGVIEIVVGGSDTIIDDFLPNNFWYILEYNPGKTAYEMKWQSKWYNYLISKIAVFDIDGDGNYAIFVCQTNGLIEIYDGRTLAKIDSFTTAASPLRQILWADADNDSISELVVCDDNKLLMYHPTTHVLEHQIPYGASDFEVGNVDSDPANEIIMANGYVLHFNGVTTTVEWNYDDDFGYLVEIADVDDDGMQEIIAAELWYYITAFDADITSPKWQIPTDLDIDALLVTDVENDGTKEVLYADRQHGEIHCYDALTGLNEKWQIPNPQSGVTEIAVFDVDKDGILEILWGAGSNTTGEDHLLVYSLRGLANEWSSQHVDGPFHAMDIGDVDSDGTEEIVFASFESGSGYDDGYVFIYDATTFQLEWQSPKNMFNGRAWTGIHALKIGDVDDDGVREIVVGTDDLRDGVIFIINGQTHAVEQSYSYDDSAPIYTLDIADVDNDDQTEIIAGGGRASTGAPGVYIYVINGSSGTVEWKSISLGAYWSEFYSVKVADIDNDDTPEIVGTNDKIYVFDGITHQMWKSTDTGFGPLDLADMDNDGIPEIVAGTSMGNVLAIDGQTYNTEATYRFGGSTIGSMVVYDIDADSSNDIVYTSSGILTVYSIQNSQNIFQSEYLSPSAGAFNGLAVSHVNRGKAVEIIVGTNINVTLCSKGSLATSLLNTPVLQLLLLTPRN